MEDRSLDTQPLVRALQDLIVAYSACGARLEEVIAALTAADPGRIRAALAAQAQAHRAVDAAEVRRRLAVRGVVHMLTGALPRPGESERGLTLTALLRLLPPESALPLQAARHDLLVVLRHLQLLQQRAATLAHSGQVVVQRTINATIGSAERYGASGERALPQRSAQSSQGRWA